MEVSVRVDFGNGEICGDRDQRTETEFDDVMYEPVKAVDAKMRLDSISFSYTYFGVWTTYYKIYLFSLIFYQ